MHTKFLKASITTALASLIFTIGSATLTTPTST